MEPPSLTTRAALWRERLPRAGTVGDRLSFTAPSKELGVGNRDLGTVQSIGKDGRISVRMDNGKHVNFDANEMRHYDHGYATTSHGSQGLTAERVLVNVDSNIHPELINTRFAYVSTSRASHDAHIYTIDASSLRAALSRDVTKASAFELGDRQRPLKGVSVEHGVGMPGAQDSGLGFAI